MTTSTRSSRQVAEAIQRTRRFYKAGVHSLEQHPDAHLPYGSRVKLVPRGRYYGYLHLARRVAAVAARPGGPPRGYTPEELENLIERCRKDGFPLGPTHVSILLRLKVKKRRKLEHAMIKGRWSCRRLGDAVRAAWGLQRVPVRMPAVPEDVQGAAARLLRLGEQLERTIGVVQRMKARPPRRLARAIKQIKEPLDELVQAADAVMRPRVEEREVRRQRGTRR